MPCKFTLNLVRNKVVLSQQDSNELRTTEVDKGISCVTVVKLLIHGIISKRISNIFFLVHCVNEISLVARVLFVSMNKSEKLEFYR